MKRAIARLGLGIIVCICLIGLVSCKEEHSHTYTVQNKVTLHILVNAETNI